MFLRLVVMFVIVAVIPLFIMRGILVANIRESLYSDRVSNIQRHCNNLISQMVSMQYYDGENEDIINNQITQLSNIYDGRIVVINNNYVVIRDSYFRIFGRTVISEQAFQSMQGAPVSRYNNDTDMVELALPVMDDEGQVLGVMIISSSTAANTSAFMSISFVSSWIVIGIAIILLVMAFVFSRNLSTPFRELGRSINHIAEGNFDESVHLKGYTEIVQISNAFNKMLSRLRTLEESRQEFVSNVSHELKTPITSIKVLADSLNMQPDAPKEMYQEFMHDIVEEIDRENQIITDLLSLVKMDKKYDDLNISSVNINEMLELILKRLRPIASKRNIELAFESSRSVVADVDEVKITLAFTNLVENAIKYNVAGGWVQVSLDMDHTYFYVKVSDSGIGIPTEYQDKIFDRFFRVDKARSRETGGTGLGLAITKNILLMHNGNIKVRSREEEGTTFVLRIPLVRESQEDI